MALTCELALIEAGYSPVRCVTLTDADNCSPFELALQLLASSDIASQFACRDSSTPRRSALILKGYDQALSRREITEMCNYMSTCTLGAVVLVREENTRDNVLDLRSSTHRQPPGATMPRIGFTRPTDADISAHLGWLLTAVHGHMDIRVEIIEEIARMSPDVVCALNALEGICSETQVVTSRDVCTGASAPLHCFWSVLQSYADFGTGDIAAVADMLETVWLIEGLTPVAKSVTAPEKVKATNVVSKSTRNVRRQKKVVHVGFEDDDSRIIIAEHVDACGNLAASALTVYAKKALTRPPKTQALFDAPEVRTHLRRGVLRNAASVVSMHARSEDIAHLSTIVHAYSKVSMHTLVADVSDTLRLSHGGRLDEPERLATAGSAIFELCRMSIISQNASLSASSITSRVKELHGRIAGAMPHKSLKRQKKH